MVVLSLFDGMACGYEALIRAGIKIDTYYASEIDKYAIQIAKKNHPDIIELGDIRNWNEWKIKKPDLIIAGSPCQGFSVAGKQLNFEDARSKLFFEFVNIVQEYKPKWFLLENVKMKKEWRDIISKILHIEPLEINSALMSAQNRKRLYWFNWNIDYPENKNIILESILEHGFSDRLKSYCVDANYYRGTNLDIYYSKKRRQIVFEKPVELTQNKSQGKRIYADYGKSVCLNALGGGGGAKTGLYYTDQGIRKLTPIECERLQTLPDNYTEGVSNSQRYKMLGNGWTVDVVAHILKGIKNEKEN